METMNMALSVQPQSADLPAVSDANTLLIWSLFAATAFCFSFGMWFLVRYVGLALRIEFEGMHLE
jgi:hypothetical protein